VAVAGYSPLGRGFLTGQIKKEDLTEGDFRKGLDRFDAANEKVVDIIKGLATKRGITPAQLCIAWVAALGPHVIPIPGSSHVRRTSENLAAGDITFTDTELAELSKVIEEIPVYGSRYPEGMAVWG